MYRIITKKRLELLEICEKIVKERVEDEGWGDSREETYHCGAKGCQFHTTSPHGLSVHRGKSHK
jgi:hypothetical protein